jgi:large conductance mechanosensitive channel
MGFAKEFRDFATKGNVVDLAVGVIIGGAFGKIVASLVNDIIMPLINPLVQNGDWRSMEIGPGIKLGSFAGSIVDFIIVALAIFVAVKAINRFKKKQEAAPAPPTKDQELLTEIRDLLKNK